MLHKSYDICSTEFSLTPYVNVIHMSLKTSKSIAIHNTIVILDLRKDGFKHLMARPTFYHHTTAVPISYTYRY